MILSEVLVAHSSGQSRFSVTLVFPKCNSRLCFLSLPQYVLSVLKNFVDNCFIDISNIKNCVFEED